MWNNKISSFKTLKAFSQSIIGDLEVVNKGLWHIMTIYGSNDSIKRRELWRILDLYSSKDLPTLIGGDFNCLLNKEDKRGGRRFRFS